MQVTPLPFHSIYAAEILLGCYCSRAVVLGPWFMCFLNLFCEVIHAEYAVTVTFAREQLNWHANRVWILCKNLHVNIFSWTIACIWDIRVKETDIFHVSSHLVHKRSLLVSIRGKYWRGSSQCGSYSRNLMLRLSDRFCQYKTSELILSVPDFLCNPEGDEKVGAISRVHRKDSDFVASQFESNLW